MMRIAAILSLSALTATTAYAQGYGERYGERYGDRYGERHGDGDRDDNRMDDARAIRSLERQFVRGWNRGDPAAMAGVYTRSADVIAPTGERAEGRAEIRDMYARNLANQFQGTTFRSRCGEIRFISQDVAEVDCRWMVQGITAPDLPETMSGIYTVVVKRVGGDQWRVAASRAMVPISRPQMTPGQ